MHHQLVRLTEGVQISPSVNNWLHVDPSNKRTWPQQVISLLDGFYYYFKNIQLEESRFIIFEKFLFHKIQLRMFRRFRLLREDHFHKNK